MSSGRPRHKGWPRYGRPARASPAHRAASTGPKAMRPPGVSTSTIGSSQNRPREPVRTMSISMPCRAASSCERRRDLVGADGAGGGIARHEEARGHRDDLARDLVDRVRRSAAPIGSPSSIADGAQAQRPRQ